MFSALLEVAMGCCVLFYYSCARIAGMNHVSEVISLDLFLVAFVCKFTPLSALHSPLARFVKK